ncbi:AtpZ/AtpI family protein [Candidatus Roizmanbacteria bacterium]|nr:AtpZ/AtpI family protein [Candidatus Roizmanbacteria bacterium]
MKRKVLQLKRGSLEVTEREVAIKDTEKEEERKRLLQSYSLVTALGVSLTIPLVGGVVIGVYLDRVFSSAPKLTLIFVFLGLFVSGVQLARLVRDTR